LVQANDGSQTDLTKHWAEKRAVLVFYMGHWCPECQKQLGQLNEHQQDFAAKHTEVIALKAKLGLTFDLYSDPELETIAKWGVADYGTNIAKPSTFVIQKGGAVTFKRIGGNTNDRPSTDEILAALTDP